MSEGKQEGRNEEEEVGDKYVRERQRGKEKP